MRSQSCPNRSPRRPAFNTLVDSKGDVGRCIAGRQTESVYSTDCAPAFSGSNWEVDLATRLGVTRKYKVERLGDGSEKRSFTAPSGLVTTSATDAGGSTTNSMPTGMSASIVPKPVITPSVYGRVFSMPIPVAR